MEFEFVLRSKCLRNLIILRPPEDTKMFNIKIGKKKINLPFYTASAFSTEITRIINQDSTIDEIEINIDDSIAQKIEDVLKGNSVIFRNKNDARLFFIFGKEIGNDEFLIPLSEYNKRERLSEVTKENVIDRINDIKLEVSEYEIDVSIYEKEFAFIAKNMSVIGKDPKFIAWCCEEGNNELALAIMNRQDILTRDECEFFDIVINICQNNKDKECFKPYNLLECIKFEYCSYDCYTRFIDFIKTNNDLSTGLNKNIIARCFERILKRSYPNQEEQIVEGRHKRFYKSKQTKDIDNGCLVELFNDVNSKIGPQGLQWIGNDGRVAIQALIGKKDDPKLNYHNIPWERNSKGDKWWNENHPWYEITFGEKYICPTGYALMGRKLCNGNLVKGWKLYGQKKNDSWVTLDEHKDSVFGFREVRTFEIKTNDMFKAFKIEMTQPENTGNWAFCIGQIEIFGDIYLKY